MSDRTYFELKIVECPASQISEVRAVLLGHSLLDDDHVLRIGDSYTVDEIRCGTAEEVADELRVRAPGASWVCWEAPKYEWLGDLYRFTPELGVFTAECDGDGEPRFPPFHIQALLDSLGTDQAAWKRALGVTHRDALTEKAEQASTSTAAASTV